MVTPQAGSVGGFSATNTPMDPILLANFQPRQWVWGDWQ